MNQLSCRRPSCGSKRSGVLWALCLLTALPGWNNAASAETFRFPSQNATYENVATDPIPVSAGVATLIISSPQHELSLLAHEVELTPLGSGVHLAELSVSFEGSGQLNVDVDVSGALQRLEDRVVVPRQSRSVEGKISIEAVADGYRIVILELPKAIDVAFESRLAQDLVKTCSEIPIFALLGVECSTLSGFLSSAAVPLPEAGTEMMLEAKELGADQKQQLDSYLAYAAGARK